MNCPHGRRHEEPCKERGCTQLVFVHRGQSVRVCKLYCDTCGRGIGIWLETVRHGSGLTARTVREFNSRHVGHARYWKFVAVDTGNEILGSGPPPIAVDSDREEDSLQ